MYEPQEDSYMLREVLVNFLQNNPQSICLDMGTGSGIQGVAMIPYSSKVIFVDINPEVIEYVKQIVKENDKYEYVVSDLFENIDLKYKGKIDVIAFNPPYLPREEDELEDIELTSGESGLEVIEKFITTSKLFLSTKGKLFFVASSLTDIELLESVLKREGFTYRVVMKKHFFFEDLLIYEAEMN